MCVRDVERVRARRKAKRERKRLEAEVVRVAIVWGRECRRINSTTYSDENRVIALIRSPGVMTDAVVNLMKFEDASPTGE